MIFLTPWSALLAAAVALPLLVLLYVLRLRRQRLRVPSTLLWEKSFEDLQANVPFQRLRWSLLLLLQLLLLLALLLALAQPMMRGQEAMATRVVLLIDRSASMNAFIGEDRGLAVTRLDAAKDAARRLIQSLSRRSSTHQVMIIAFASTAQIVTTFESNHGALLDAIDSIGPTHEQGDLSDALELAGAFTGSGEDEVETPDVVLFSDGGAGEANERGGYRLRSGHFRFVQIVPADAPPTSNVGISSFSVRRDDEDAARVLMFARLVNAGAQPVETVATLAMDDRPVAALRATIPAATEAGPGEQTIAHRFEAAEGAALTLRHNHRDDLAADDVARLVLTAPRQPRLFLVHPDGGAADPFLHDLLAAMEPERLDVIAAEGFAEHVLRSDLGDRYDMVVFDRVSPPRLPNVGSLTIGAVPAEAGAGVAAESADSGQLILSWDRQHPVMRNVSLDTIVFSDVAALQLTPQAVPLASGAAGPVMAEWRAGVARHLAVGFEMRKSNWPLHVSSAIFMQNAIEYLTLGSRSTLAPGEHGLAFRAGEAVNVRVAGDARELVIEGPVRARIAAEAGTIIALPALRTADWYTIRGAAPPFERVAVNVSSDLESDTRLREAVTVNAETAKGRGSQSIAAQPVWHWLIAAAFVLLIIEWLIYCRRARGH